MKTIILTLLLTLASSYALEINCVASRYLGLKKYSLHLKEIDLKKRETTLVLFSDHEVNILVNSDVKIWADYIEGTNLLTVETRDMSVDGYLDMQRGSGDIEIEGKSYSLNDCEFKR